MNTQDKIKKLIGHYKGLGILRTFCDPKIVIKDLESLLKPECGHKNTKLLSSQKLSNNNTVTEVYLCWDCGEIIKITS